MHLVTPTFAASVALFVGAFALGNAPSLVSAQTTAEAAAPAPWGVLVSTGDPGGETSSAVQTAWQARIEQQAQTTGVPIVGVDRLSALLSLDTDTIARTDLERLSQVESQLLQARAHAAQLAEADAFSVLLAAEQTLRSLLHVPGAVAFYAETQTSIGLVAAQAGLEGLAVAALRRAAVVDPTRGVRAAETTPTWLARASAISREVATSAQAEVPITTNVAGARIYLDDKLQGTAPLRLRTTRGVHILRVEAAGYRALGTLLPTEAGLRPTVHLELTHDPVTHALADLTEAARRSDTTAVHAAVSTLRRLDAPIDAAWLMTVSTARDDRALLTRCDANDCEPAQRLELDRTGASGDHYGRVLDPAGFGRDRRTRDHAWLVATEPVAARDPQMRAASPWWTRWYVWGAAIAVVGGATAAIALSDGPDTQRLRLTIDP